MMPKEIPSKSIFLALGANLPGAWGTPEEALAKVVKELATVGVSVISCSRLYKSRAVGPGMQQNYFNAVISIATDHSPSALLRICKRLERRAGRRRGRVWGPRPLDIDIVDYAGRRIGPAKFRHRPGLALPHPEAHKRGFVLIPLRDVAPSWRHPRTHRPIADLIRNLPASQRNGVGRALAFSVAACD